MDKKKQKLKAITNLVTTMPPSQIRKNQAGLLALAPNIQQIFQEKVDLPHTLQTDPKTGEKFIRTELNRYGNSYRSPYTNSYIPAPQALQKDPYYPSQTIREFQEKANSLFKEYTKLYYEQGAVGNFYVNQSQDGFNCGFFVKKECDPNKGIIGTWDTFNTIDVKMDASKKVTYKLATNVLLDIVFKNEGCGQVAMFGQIKKNKEETQKIAQEKYLDDFHLGNIGRMIEDMETNIRQQVEAVNAGKIRGIIQSTRYQNTKAVEQSRAALAKEINQQKAVIQAFEDKEALVKSLY